MTNFLNRYRDLVFRKMSVGASSMNTLDGQKDHLFMLLMTFMLPLSLIAFLPGINYSFEIGLIGMAYWDIVILVVMIFISLPIGYPLKIRKLIFISGIYSIGVVTTYYVGITGPGMIYILTSLIFGIILFPKKYAYFFASLNTVIYFSFGLLVYSQMVHWPIKLERKDLTEEYFMVVSNFIFLSYCFALLIPYLFDRLQEKIEQLMFMGEEINRKNSQLEEAIAKVENQKNEIANFAFIASHDLQEPLRSIQLFSDKLEKNEEDELSDKGKQYLHYISEGAHQMRKMIRALSDYSFAYHEYSNYIPILLSDFLSEIQNALNKEYPASKLCVMLERDATVILPKHLLKIAFFRILENSLIYGNSEKIKNIEIKMSEDDLGYHFVFRDSSFNLPDNIKNWIQSSTEFPEQKLKGNDIGFSALIKIIGDLQGRLELLEDRGNGLHLIVFLPKHVNS